jgi:hypothetical protein
MISGVMGIIWPEESFISTIQACEKYGRYIFQKVALSMRNCTTDER